MKKGFIHSHYAWTDIINFLPIIKYYSTFYDELIVLTASDKKIIVDFFCKNIPNVKQIYIDINILDEESRGILNLLSKFDSSDLLEYIIKNKDINLLEYDLLIHGFPDHYRRDNLKSIYSKLFNTCHFVKGFYIHYNIPYETRINMFDFNRDLNKEDELFNDFISKYGNNYVLYHDDPSRNGGISLPIVKNSNYTYINLHGKANDIFFYIKILENSKELHLVDSIWASFCYMLDAKTGIFKEKNIYLYPLLGRPGGCLNYGQKIIEPINLNNWSIINYH